MSERSLVRQCSPTMAGIKTGNLFMCDFSSRKEIESDVRSFNQHMKEKGICASFLGVRNGRAMIYVYRPRLLKKDLQDPLARSILFSNGYKCESIGGCLECLRRRMDKCGDFPHEIGLMLGYPAEDVKGFIENEGKNFKQCGLWKVYGDEVKASKLWAKYRKCTYVYSKCFENGTNIDRLTVPV
ncbi:MAG: DUF3793 family protein [Clostridiales bacterium]|nr:DUF3793 family protein [Clostridiales bacterium]